jgi:hypothetical protein
MLADRTFQVLTCLCCTLRWLAVFPGALTTESCSALNQQGSTAQRSPHSPLPSRQLANHTPALSAVLLLAAGAGCAAATAAA